MSAGRPDPVEAGCSSAATGRPGERASSAQTRPSPRASTGTFAAATADDAARALAAAAVRRRRWGETTGEARGAVLRRAADLLEARLDEAALRLVADMGKALGDARAEAGRTVAILRYNAADPLQPDRRDLRQQRTRYVRADDHRAGRRRLRDHAVELPAGDSRLEARSGPCVWQRRRLEARVGAAGSAALLAEILAEAGLPAGRAQYAHGVRSGARRRARRCLRRTRSRSPARSPSATACGSRPPRPA